MKLKYLILPLLIAVGIDLSYADSKEATLRDWRTSKVSRTLKSVAGDQSTTEIVERIKVAFTPNGKYKTNTGSRGTWILEGETLRTVESTDGVSGREILPRRM